MNFYERQDKLVMAHDKMLHKFMETEDLDYWRAARTLAMEVLRLERTDGAYRHTCRLERMYSMTKAERGE